MPQPGTPAALMPPGEDFLIRAIQEMDRKRLEDQAALAQSFQGTVAQLQAAQADLAAAQAELATQTAYLSSLISRDASIGNFNTGTLTNDSSYHLIGSEASLTLPVATGKARVTISCSEASIAPGANSVVAIICFAIDGVGSLDPTTQYARLYTVGNPIGTSLVRVGTVTVTPGTTTIRARCAYWSAGSSSASINFSGLRLLVEVIGAD